MRYLVSGSEGPGFSSPQEAVKILEETVLPSFDYLIQLETDKKILAGGLPVGDRGFVFIIDASSNEELDQILRSMPMWGSLQWEIIPLQPFKGRADYERNALKELKK